MTFCCTSYQVQRVQYTKWSVILYCGKQIYIVQLLSWDEVWLCHHASVSKACYHKDVLVFITLFAKILITSLFTCIKHPLQVTCTFFFLSLSCQGCVDTEGNCGWCVYDFSCTGQSQDCSIADSFVTVSYILFNNC